MNKYTAINFARRVYHFSRRIGYKVTGILMQRKEKEKIVFVFGGRNDGWPTIGRDFYHKNPLFMETIQLCNSVLTEIGGPEILSYFEGPVNKEYFDDDESRFTCITAIQLATVKIYNDRGIYPNAVMGVSLGEPAAAFAAGALSLEEALYLSVSYMTIFKSGNVSYSFLLLSLGFNAAQQFCLESPVWTEIVYEDSTHAVLITCHKNDIEQLEAFFRSRQLDFKIVSKKEMVPYHSSKIRSHKEMMQEFHKKIIPKPLKCDYYSPTLGRNIPKNTILPNDYWFDLPCVPVLVHRVFQTLIEDGYRIFFQAGPPALSERQFRTASLAKLTILNSSETDADEIRHFQMISKKILKLKLKPSLLFESESIAFDDFKNDFNVNSGTPAASYEYLRKKGPIHFLPQHHAWIILNYDDIEQVLREPAVFSSSLLKEYDPILLGADPDVHKVIRTLLQPLFSPAVIAEMAQFTTDTAEEILTVLCKQDNFDFVKDYSDPLSLLVLCNFFGLSSTDANHMLAYTGKDYHNMQYWQRLEEFFQDQFTTCMLTKEDCLWGKLRELVKKDEFTFPDAISLLRIVWTAGMATTSALISTSINITLNEPQVTGQISTDEKLVSRFIEECLRLETPLSAIYRITTEPVVLCGQELPANAIVLLHLKSGMTDPAQYSNPEEFSVTRPAKRHLAFGTGIHQCIGMGIARAEARSALQVVLKKLPDLKHYAYAQPEYITISELKTMSSLKLYRNTDQ